MAEETQVTTTAAAEAAPATAPVVAPVSSGEGTPATDVAATVTQPTTPATGTDGATATAAAPTVNPAFGLIGKQYGFTDEELSAMPAGALSKMLDRQAQEAVNTLQQWEDSENAAAEQAKVQPALTPAPATTATEAVAAGAFDVSQYTVDNGYDEGSIALAQAVESVNKTNAELKARLDKIDSQWAEDVAPAAASYREQKQQALDKEVNAFYDTELKDFSALVGVSGGELTPEQKRVRTLLQKDAGVFQGLKRQAGLACSPKEALMAAFTARHIKDIKALLSGALVTANAKQVAAAGPAPRGTKPIAAVKDPRAEGIAEIEAYKRKHQDQSRG